MSPKDLFHYRDLIDLFDQLFFESTNTCLVKGEDEPIYLPMSTDNPNHQVVFAHGFFASALHEIAHWCVAGEKRRQLIDYGYWYAPDGRDEKQQKAFEQVEIKPQAIEWAFSLACGKPFDVSVDNLSGVETNRCVFRKSVFNQMKTYTEEGFPERAEQFINVLCRFYKQPSIRYQLEELLCNESFA